MTKGTSPDGEHLYPAFPYTSYQRMSVNDLRDLFAFLKTLPAVRTAARPSTSCRSRSIFAALIGGWKLLFLDGCRSSRSAESLTIGTEAHIW